LTKEEKKAAIERAVKEHLDNHEAAGEADIPDGLAPMVAPALAKAFSEKLARIFGDQT
jgi:hypothetical protein